MQPTGACCRLCRGQHLRHSCELRLLVPSLSVNAWSIRTGWVPAAATSRMIVSFRHSQKGRTPARSAPCLTYLLPACGSVVLHIWSAETDLVPVQKARLLPPARPHAARPAARTHTQVPQV